MTGKEKCRELKEIRRQTAERLGIDLHQTECKYEGECKGTCPKCKAEELRLNAELLKRKAVVVGGAAGLALGLTACSNPLAKVFQDNQPISGAAVGTEEENAVILGETEVRPDLEDTILSGEVEWEPEVVDGGIEMMDFDMDTEESSAVDIDAALDQMMGE